MGKLEVADPESLSQKLTALRHEILADPYFARVGSFKPERPKTTHGFHAYNDLGSPLSGFQTPKFRRHGSGSTISLANSSNGLAEQLQRRVTSTSATPM